MLKAILYLFRANLYLQFRTPIKLLISLISPISFGFVYIIQIYIIYFVNPNAFGGLPRAYFLAAFFGNQLAYFLKAFATESSMSKISQSVYNAELDLLLIRPINIFVFKYFRFYWVAGTVMVPVYFFLLLYQLIQLPIDTISAIKVFVLMTCSCLIQVTLMAVVHNMAFYMRNIDYINRIIQKIMGLATFKPPEIFPILLRNMLIYIIPAIVVGGFMFDIVRGYDSVLTWLIIFFWTVILIGINNYTWHNGLKRYESVG